MKRAIFVLVALLMVLSVVPALADNGAPNGPHYNLNVIGVTNPKNSGMNCGNGGRIFVPLYGKTQILLSPAEDYQVVDCNGTDGTSAAFSLPAPDPNNDGTTEYSVWVRALGKPGGSSSTTTCAYAGDELYCSVYSMDLTRTKGQQQFKDYSKELLYVYADIDADGNLERVPLFDAALQGYYWDYDNNGLKLAQFRFYDVSSTVP